MPQHTDLERDLRLIETALRKLETDYNMFFAGQLPRPPWETRRRVETLLSRLDRAYVQSAVDRFRLSTLQARFSTFADLWDRALRAREEGRPGPFSKPSRTSPPAGPAPPSPPADRTVGSETLSNVERDGGKVETLYEALLQARQAVGTDAPFPFQRFADIVRGQVVKLRQAGSAEVAFRVSIKDGRVVFTARGVGTGGAETPG